VERKGEEVDSMTSYQTMMKYPVEFITDVILGFLYKCFGDVTNFTEKCTELGPQ
jgi:hypothetical protein